jgi:hypothetical protein
VIFALGLTALLALTGLSIDSLRVFIAYGQAQRAAEAAALAGVPYVPQYLTAATRAPDGNDAADRVLLAAAQNGFADQSMITITPSAGPPATLTVTIRISVALTLISLVNPSPAVSNASATAEMLPPIALGDSSGSFGTSNGTGETAIIAGPNELKERGDPYSVLCEDGWSQASDTTYGDAPTNSYTTRLGTASNAPQYPAGPNCSPGTPGNPDVVAADFGGLQIGDNPVTTGESYLITIPPGNGQYSVWVYNPRFAYGASGNYSRFFTNESVFHSGTDKPALYPQIAFSLYAVPELYHRADVPLAAIWPSSASTPDTRPNPPLSAAQIYRDPPVDAYWLDDLLHGCILKVWTAEGSCIITPADIGNWVQLPTATPLTATATAPAYYRLTASSTTGDDTGYGEQEYAVKICQSPGKPGDPCSSGGASLSAWNAETVSLHSSTLSATFPLANIPAAYAGRDVALHIFNAGVGSGNVTLALLPPAGGGSVTYPGYLRLAINGSTTAIQTSINGDSHYHGKWVDLTLTLPPDYAGGEWQLQWTSDIAPPDATMTIAATLEGTAISLIA